MVNVVDSTGKAYDNILPRKDFVFSIAMVTQCYNNDYFIRPQEGDKILYRVVDGEIKPYMGIDFGDMHVEPQYIFKQKGDMSEKMKTFICPDYYKVPIYIHDTRQNIYFSCIGPKGTAHYFIVSNESTKGIEWKDNDEDRSPMMALASDEDYFYFLYDDYRSKEESAKSSPIKKQLLKKQS